MKSNIIVLLISTSVAMHGQSLKEAIKKTESENFESAAADFRALVAKEPTKGENYFYFGENYFQNEQPDSANMYYTKGTEVNATNPLNYVGVGKVLLTKNRADDAKAQFYKATSLGANKNAEVFRRIAEAWLETTVKDAEEAIKLINQAVKLEPKNAENYILLGDAQFQKNPTDGSAPVKSYQMAISLDPKSPKGLLRIGRLYQLGQNFQLALDYYKKALELDPNFAPAHRQIAELYARYNQQNKAIESWKRYLELNNSKDARYKYIGSLFNNKQYQDVITEYQTLKRSNFTNLYLERLTGYSYEELGDKTDKEAYQKGLRAIDTFFRMAGPGFKYIPSDYKYRGLLLIRNGKDSLGEIELEKAITMDPALGGESWSKAARAYMDVKNYEKAAGVLDKKKNGSFKNLSIQDANDYGRACYFLFQRKNEELNALPKKPKKQEPEAVRKKAQADSLMRFVDSAFKRVSEVNPAYVMAYIYRGRANSFLDQEMKSDSAKVMYEKAIQVMKPEERTGSYKNSLIEALEYLGYYYVRQKNDAKAKEIFNELKTIDPNNEKAKSYFNPPKTSPQKPAGK
jgi:tetratricopeptide (TPR) repeat protein